VDLESRGSVTVVVFDVKGRFVRTVWNGVLPEGRNLVRWDGTNGDGHPVATGVYFARAVGTGVVKTIKITLLR
jgi:flagellar hook assembly protein FlgD